MSTADRYRAFACECMRWAERAQDVERRETLLEMATRWAQAAALVDHQHTLIEQFNGLAVGAKRQLSTARQAKDGGGPIKAADGSELTVDRNELAKKRTAVGEPSGSQVKRGQLANSAIAYVLSTTERGPRMRASSPNS